MKRNLGICIFILFIIAVSVTVIMDNIDANKKEEQIYTNENNPKINADSLVKANANVNSYNYYIGIENNKIIVFEGKSFRKYLETDIPIEELPTDIQMKLTKKIGYNNLSEVYDFLESYSS